MDNIQAKKCLYWYDEQFNNAESFDSDESIVAIRDLLRDLAQGRKVVCLPFSDGHLHEVFKHDEDLSIPHAVRAHYEDVGFNRACIAMLKTGLIRKSNP